MMNAVLSTTSSLWRLPTTRVIVSSILSLPFSIATCAQSYSVLIRNAVRVKMRDGIVLVADVYEPQSTEKFPVLVNRTPYSRATHAAVANGLASHGYLVVLEDTRGRFDSDGEFYPFRYEMQDGCDTVEWAAALPSSSGRVGMFGASYEGATQWLAALAKPPHLVALFPELTSSEYREGWIYQSGALMQWFASSWTSDLATDTLRHKAEEDVDLKRWTMQLPIDSYRILEPPSVSTLAPYFRDWIVHEHDDQYWRPWKISDHYRELNIKVLHLGGWHDIFLKGSITNFLGMQTSSPAAADQRLLIDPRSHGEDDKATGRVGDVTFGQGALVDETREALHWFDYTLKGLPTEYAAGSPVRIFVMGENVWRDEQEFPLKRTRYTKYYLHHAGLSTEPPGDEPPESYNYNPAKPVPTIGGRLCCANDELPPGPFDQRANEKRPDVLVFSTPPLVNDIEITGFVRAEIYAATSAADTDFTAMLTDVEPSGYSRFLTDGIVRASHRNPTAEGEAIKAGQVYEYDIDLWATSNVFKAGHRIRLSISSSNFPRFNRNLNTGEALHASTRMVTARQKVYHDSKHLSAVVLPLIPR
jgi:putative CocE/NonD family hydrolase